MPASKLLVYRMPASRTQGLVTCGIAAALLVMFTATLFFRTELFQSQRLPSREVFVAISGVIMVMSDWIIATLLLAQARVLQSRPLYVLAAGYFLAGLFMALRILSLAGALGPVERRFDPTYNLPLWFYLSSHAALPLAIIPYAWLSQATDRSSGTEPFQRRSPERYLVKAMILAGGVIVILAAAKTLLPWSSPIFLSASAVMLLIIAGMAVLARGVHSELDLWLLLMLWGWFLEMALIAESSVGYTAGWYAARTLGLMSGLFVLFALLAETSKLYAQSVLQLIAQNQEREHRFLIRDVMSASIAHELRQPLAAIMINAEVARKLACGRQDKAAPPPDETSQVLDEIVASSHRANDILESTRAIFRRGNVERISVNPALILQSTLALIESSARMHNVSVKLMVEGQPGPIAVNRLQFQQALLNLFQNAIEALTQSNERRRVLLVRCCRGENGEVVIRVADNGPGIAPVVRNKIFDAFFTTRPEASGMGLLIARSVIRAHGGKLAVEAHSPVGTVFVIQLPQEKTASAVSARPQPRASALH
ncbi:MAG TPA: ATP-binding protein [Rhizomicrobium sp.]|nr:ATP-binding protein [Rhizomicrobium sp.]